MNGADVRTFEHGIAPGWSDGMGQYFLYANFDLREYFMIDALGGSTKASGIGRNLGARALGLLVTANADTRVPEVGRWRGHRVAAVGDYFPPGLLAVDLPPDVPPFGHITEHFRDLSSAIAVMLFRHDGPDDLLALAASDADLYVLLSELALHHSIPDLEHALSTTFGPRWKKLYAEKREHVFRPTAPPSLPDPSETGCVGSDEPGG